MKKLFKAALGAGIVYYGLPYILAQIANFGVYREGSGTKPQIALTFDDGPDPEATPKILEILQEYRVKATFFMQGVSAKAYPHIVADVVAQGHEVAAHGEQHIHAYTQAPQHTLHNIAQGISSIYQVSGEYPRFFRPPHGAYTLATLYAMLTSPVKMAHWTLEAHDWHPNYSPEQVVERVLRYAEPGGVIVMHDANAGAKNSVQALPEILRQLKSNGYQVVPLRDLEGLKTANPRNVLRRMWDVFERHYQNKNHIDHASRHARSIMRLGLAPFIGQEIVTRDGTVVRTGDTQAELHLHSARLVNMAQSNPVAAFRSLTHSLKEVANMLQTNPKYQDVQVVFGASLFHKLVEPLGFSISDIANPKEAEHLTRWMSLIRGIYSDMPNREPLTAKLVWMDRATLLEKYGR